MAAVLKRLLKAAQPSVALVRLYFGFSELSELGHLALCLRVVSVWRWGNFRDTLFSF